MNLTLDQPRTDQVDFSAPHKNAALARVANTPQVDARTAQNAAQPLSDLQKSLVAQAHFVNQHGLPADQGPDTMPDQITTPGPGRRVSFRGDNGLPGSKGREGDAMRRRIYLAFVLTSSLGLAANNNDWPNVKKDCDAVIHATVPAPLWKRVMACGTDFFTARPVHLTVKSIVPGGGFGLGPTFSQPFNRGKWQQEFDATGVGTFSKFWQTEAKFLSSHDKFGVNNSARDRFAYEIYARVRDLPDMVYYGIGPNTSTTSLANFHERDVSAGGDVFNPFSSWFAAGRTNRELVDGGGCGYFGIEPGSDHFGVQRKHCARTHFAAEPDSLRGLRRAAPHPA